MPPDPMSGDALRPAPPLPVAGTRWSLFLDVDGTLVEIGPTPDRVVVPDLLPVLLDGLRLALGGALALVSGRELAALDALFPGTALDMAGGHGAEYRCNGRDDRTTAPALPVDAIARRLDDLPAAYPGTIIERKRRSVALHYRQSALPPPEARQRLVAACAAEGAVARVLDGKRVSEAIACGIDKGAAIDRFLAQPPYAGSRPIYAGDDTTDEDGFAAVERAGGVSIRIAGEAMARTRARFALASPLALHDWLAQWLSSLLQPVQSGKADRVAKEALPLDGGGLGGGDSAAETLKFHQGPVSPHHHPHLGPPPSRGK